MGVQGIVAGHDCRPDGWYADVDQEKGGEGAGKEDGKHVCKWRWERLERLNLQD